MADNPITVPLPADLPTNWTQGQIVAPNGADVGQPEQRGYNYSAEQINAAQAAAQQLGAAFPNLYGKGDTVPVTDGGTGASTAPQALVNLGAIPAAEKGQPNGVATLGADGKLPSSQSPSSVVLIGAQYDRSGDFEDLELGYNVGWGSPSTSKSGRFFTAGENARMYGDESGKTWEHQGSTNSNLTVSATAVNSPGVAVALRHSTSADDWAIFRYTDGGRTLESQTTVGAASSVSNGADICLNDAGQSVYFISDIANSARYSTDAAKTFLTPTGLPATGVYARVDINASGLVGMTISNVLYESLNGGQSFANKGTPLSPATAYANNDLGERMIIGTTSVSGGRAAKFSADGVTWEDRVVPVYLRVVDRDITFKMTNKFILLGNYISYDKAITWEVLPLSSDANTALWENGSLAQVLPDTTLIKYAPALQVSVLTDIDGNVIGEVVTTL